MKYIIIATTVERYNMFVKCIESVIKYAPNYKIIAMVQGDPGLIDYLKYTNVKYIFSNDRIGPHSAKLVCLRSININRSNIYLSLDDDIELTEYTDLETPEFILMNKPEIGLMSLGWVKHENLVDVRNIKKEIVKQNIVYTGGGLMFKENIKLLLMKHPDTNYWCDNTEWSLLSYLNGFENYRYKGSISIHRVCSNGGRKLWVAENKTTLPDTRYITLRKGSSGSYLIPKDADMTALTKIIHDGR